MDEPTSTCQRCGKTVTFVLTGVNTGKWLVNPKRKQEWRCGNDPLHPVLTHLPGDREVQR